MAQLVFQLFICCNIKGHEEHAFLNGLHLQFKPMLGSIRKVKTTSHTARWSSCHTFTDPGKQFCFFNSRIYLQHGMTEQLLTGEPALRQGDIIYIAVPPLTVNDK